jgi:hypothetical protein
MNVCRHGVAAAMAAVLVCSMVVLAADEAKPKAKEGDKGQITGVIQKIDHGKVTIKSAEETLTVMPYWRGGMPKDGGGFDHATLEKLEKFKAGDRVTVTWTFEEHHRIDSIQKVESGEPAK